MTPAQLRALAAAAAGESPKETANRLVLAYETVKQQRYLAAKALGARSVPHAVAIAIRDGWIAAEQIEGGMAP